MEPLLTIILIAGAVALVLSVLLPRPTATVIYVPVELETPQRGIGCLPLILLGILLYIALRLIS